MCYHFNNATKLTETTCGCFSSFMMAISRFKRSPRAGSTISLLSNTFIANFVFVGVCTAS